jgi:hypothetical protein
MKENHIPIEKERKMDVPTFRILEKRDFEGVLELMKAIKPDIGGRRDPTFYYALCCEALVDKRVVLVVGEEQSKIIAFLLAIIDPNRWLISFMIRHPLIGIERALNISYDRFIKLFKNKSEKKTEDLENSLQKYIKPNSSNKSWKDSTPEIAKLLFDAVAESHRGRHIAKGMREYMLELLAKRGVRRADGTILYNNISSIHVSYGSGFDIHNLGDQLFVTKDIRSKE